jgi:hypothetical protein
MDAHALALSRYERSAMSDKCSCGEKFRTAEDFRDHLPCPASTDRIDAPEDDNEITEHDRNPANIMMRAGYLQGLAARASGLDRVFLLRASRSLRAFAETKIES